MATLTLDDVLKVATLARLGLDENQAQSYAQDLSKILSMMDILSQVDTDNVKPLTNVHDATQTLRADIASTDIDRNANQAIAPMVQDGLYLVPQVIE